MLTEHILDGAAESVTGGARMSRYWLLLKPWPDGTQRAALNQVENLADASHAGRF
jgi:hypothetical protein